MVTAAKAVAYTVLGIFVLLIVLALVIQIPAVQNRIVSEAVSFVQKKIGTRVELAYFGLSFPKAIVLEGLFVEDQSQDTLLYIGRLSIDTDLWALTRNTIELNDVSINNADIRVRRSAIDSAFNFNYIIDAFAGEEQPADTTPSKPWTFNVEDIDLKDVRLRYLDSIAKMQVHLRLHALEIGVDELDLAGPDIRFDEIMLSDVQADVVSWQTVETSARTVESAISEDVSDSSTFNLSFSNISLRNVNAVYRQTTLGQYARLNLGAFMAGAKEVDLLRKVISLETVELSDTFISYQQLPGDGTSSAKEQTGRSVSSDASTKNTASANSRSQAAIDTTAALNRALDLDWNVSVAALKLTNNNIQYYDFTTGIKPGVDFQHLWLTRFNLIADDLHASEAGIRATIRSAAFSERSGLALNQLQARLNVTNREAELQDLILRTPLSNIQGSLTASYSALGSLSEDYGNAMFDLRIPASTISISDVILLAPDALTGLPVTVPEDATIQLEAKANGAVKDMQLAHLGISVMDSTQLQLVGRVKGLPSQDARFDLELKRFYTTRNNVNILLPDTLLSLELPEWLLLTGTAQGTFNDPTADLSLNSSLGSITTKASLRGLNGQAPAYNARIKVTEFDIGKLLRQSESMGTVSLEAAADGRGFTKETIQTKLDVVVNQFLYQEYAYRDLQVHGTLTRYLFSGKAWMNDPNLDFELDGDIDYTTDVPGYAVKFTLDNADFRALHLSSRPLKTRVIIEANLATRDFTSINGNLDIRKFGIYNGDALYMVDSLLFASIDQEGESKISIRSDIVSGDFEGTINLAAMPEALRRHFNNYYTLHDPAYDKPAGVQKFTFNLVLKNTELITEVLVPELEPFVPGRIEGMFDSEQKVLDLHANVSRIQYGQIGLDSLTLNVNSDPDNLSYAVGLRKIRLDTLLIEAFRITGEVASDSIRTKLVILDSLLKEKYSLGGAFYSQRDAMQFRFLPDQVTMNYAPWTTPADNYLRFTNEGILANNFSITNINESISLVTREQADARTAIEFKDLNLQNLTNIVEAKVLADGLINGDFMLSGKGQFNSALTIKGLEILGIEWGDLALNLSHEATGRYLVDLGLNGINMELKVKGDYLPDSVNSTIDLAADISRINLVAIEPLTAGQLKNSSGSVAGEVTLKGNPASPEIRGFLSFQKAAVVPSFVNSRFLLQDERIAFTADGIVLQNFRILDEQNNAATIRGTLKTKNYTSFDLDLRLNAQNFQLLNTKEGENELFYGKVGINTTATVKGTLTEPKVNMNISLNEDSQFTYIIPQSEKGVLEQKGIVVFKDKDADKDPFLRSINPKDSVVSRFTGLDLTANIELDGNEQLSVVVDPLTGDKLSVKGTSTLTLDINPSGDMQLAGRYEITEGTYDFTFYKFVKRSFKIEKGSSITWSGEPLEAIMDIRASYEVETSSMELLSTQLSNLSPEEINTYRQRLPFLVFLNIDGELMTPEISFELDMPAEKRNALSGAPYRAIQDINTRESDLNKQVFALLILKRFITDDVFDNQSGSSVEATARRSVSKLLTEQLNRMSENIKGVELSFDVRSDEDYSTGQAQGTTELQLGVSKSLLDDRLIVKVSGNVDIEGNKSRQSSFTDYVGDLALEYKLTEDGRFRITGFRNTNYDIISGELIETGAGVIYIKDYDTLRELFKANAKTKQK